MRPPRDPPLRAHTPTPPAEIVPASLSTPRDSLHRVRAGEKRRCCTGSLAREMGRGSGMSSGLRALGELAEGGRAVRKYEGPVTAVAGLPLGLVHFLRQGLEARPLSTSSTSRARPAISPRPPIPAEVVRTSRSLPSSTVADPDGADTESPVDTEAIEAHADNIKSVQTHTFELPPLTQGQLSLLYAYTTPPPESALTAFANRIAIPDPKTGEPLSLASDLAIVEQALIHESFWDGVRALQDVIPLSSDKNPTRRYTNFHDIRLSDSPTTSEVFAHNGSLAALGNSLLGTFATELVLESFPNLPTRAAKAAVTLYVGPKSLAGVAGHLWGVGPSRLEKALVGHEPPPRPSKKDLAYGHLVEGRGGARKLGPETGATETAGGPGLIRWNRKPTTPNKDAVLFEDAMASVARAVVGAVYQKHGFTAARAFAHAHFLARLAPPPSTTLASPSAATDLTPLLKFTQPTKVLAASLAQYNLPPLRHALLKETGRLSAHPIFVSGVFSGDVKLGEGFGSSIRMSEFRASEDALRRVYLGGGRQKGGLPSDGALFEGWTNADGWTEVDIESRS
ncbi:60S ribosomal protein L3 [Rhodotorula toruloides]|nr:60S ribosomal protein L3 [Rhodotorula toruloides]